MAMAEDNGKDISNHHEDKHVGGMDNCNGVISTTSSTNGGAGVSATEMVTVTKTETEITPTANKAGATANGSLKRKASEENSEHKEILISDHVQYWKKESVTSDEKNNPDLIELINNLPYIRNSPQGRIIVDEKTKLDGMMESNVSVVPISHEEDGNSLQEDVDVPDASSSSLSLIDSVDDDDDAAMAEAFSKASKAELSAMVKTLIRERKVERKVSALAALVRTYIKDTHQKATVTSMTLIQLADLSQAHAVTDAQNTQAADERDAEKRLRRMEVEKHRHEEDKHVYERFAKPNMYRDQIVDCAKDLKEYSTVELLNEEKSGVPKFMNLYKKCFEIASFLDRRESWFTDKKTYKLCLDKTIKIFRRFAKDNDILKQFQCEEYSYITEFMNVLRNAIRQKGGTKPEILQSKFTNLGSTFVDKTDWVILEGSGTDADFYDVCEKLVKKLIPRMLWLPGPTTQEVCGVQPLFEQMLRCIAAEVPFASSVKDSKPPRFSPKKGHLAPKLAIGGSHERVRRMPDITLWTSGKRVVVMDDDIIRLTFELKPGQRIGQHPLALFQECLNQGMSHSAKSLIQALNFGPGVAAHCTFVVATPVYIRVMKMCSVFPGTPESKVKLQWSQFFPLVSEIGFTRFYKADLRCGKMRFWKEVESLKKNLNVGKNGMDPKFAFLAIRKLMTSSRQELVGVNMIHSNLIGCGTFGTIIGSTNCNSSVLKVPKIGRNYFLLKELSILKHLEISQDQQISDGANHVIKLKGYGEKEMNFGGFLINMPCLCLSPKGRSAYSYAPNDLTEMTNMIAEGLKLGLNFIHSRSIVHNDLSFQNFIVEGKRAVIIDFGSAEPEYSNMDRIVGTPNFCHRDPLKNPTH